MYSRRNSDTQTLHAGGWIFRWTERREMAQNYFDEVSIQKLFGHEAAEDEDPTRLREYYFKSQIYDKVITDLPLRVLVGHKGIGKSALFQIAILEQCENNKVVVVVKPDDILDLARDHD